MGEKGKQKIVIFRNKEGICTDQKSILQAFFRLGFLGTVTCFPSLAAQFKPDRPIQETYSHVNTDKAFYLYLLGFVKRFLWLAPCLSFHFLGQRTHTSMIKLESAALLGPLCTFPDPAVSVHFISCLVTCTSREFAFSLLLLYTVVITWMLHTRGVFLLTYFDIYLIIEIEQYHCVTG